MAGQEELPIKEYVRIELTQNQRESIRGRLLAWFDYFEQNTPEGQILGDQEMAAFERKQRADRFPCPFLMDGKCSIYPVRPLACRTHVEALSAENCRADPNRETAAPAKEVVGYAVSQLTRLDGKLFLRPIAYGVMELFNIPRRQKSRPVALQVSDSR